MMKLAQIKGRMPVLFALLILVMGLMALVRRCDERRTPGLVEHFLRPADDTLVVAIEMSPLTYNLENDTASGFDYEIIRSIASRHGLPVVFHPTAHLDKAFEGLYLGDYDMVVASIAATNTLKQYFTITEPVYLDRQVLVQRRDSSGRAPLTSQEQLIGDTIWLTEGSTVRSRLRNLSFELGDTIHTVGDTEHSAEHLAILVALGEIKQVVVNEAVARRIAADYPVLDISTPITFTQFQTWALAPRDSILLDSLNRWLAQFKSSQQYEALVKRYLE